MQSYCPTKRFFLGKEEKALAVKLDCRKQDMIEILLT